MARKYSHSELFYDQQTLNLIDWAREQDYINHNHWATKRLNKLLKKGTPRLWERYRSLGYKNVLKAIKDDVSYNKSYNTARHIIKRLHEKGNYKYEVADIRKMTTKQINARFKDIIREDYEALLAEGKTTYEAADWMHSNWYYGGTP